MSIHALTKKSRRSRREQADAPVPRVYSEAERQRLANEFSPALVEVLETVADAWGNKVRLEPLEEQKSKSR